MLTPALQSAMETLIAALQQSEEYQDYQALKEIVMGDETHKALLKEYQKAQTALQVAAMAGQEAAAETVERFSKLSSLLYRNDEVAQYLLSQLRLQKLTGEVLQRLHQAAGLEIDLPGL